MNKKNIIKTINRTKINIIRIHIIVKKKVNQSKEKDLPKKKKVS